MSNQIIGNHKEYIVIERKSLEELEKKIKENIDFKNLEALRIIEWIKENNIYNHDFKIKN